MRIVFLGTGEFGIPVLETLESGHHDLIGVVTGPDLPDGRGRKLRPTPIKLVAESLNLPLLTPAKLRDTQFHKDFSDWMPDIAVVVAFKILPPEVFDMPRLGTLNIHPSLLPAYRGPAPINWAIINGESETGVSIIRITKRIDAGGVLLQRRLKIQKDETAGDLTARAAIIGSEMIHDAIEGVQTDKLAPLPQDENLVTRAPKLQKEDGFLNWNETAINLHNRIRGVSPWPGAYSILDGKKVKLYNSNLAGDAGNKPGEIIDVVDKLTISCAEGALSFTDIQLEGKRRMAVSDFIRGYNLTKGMVIGKNDETDK